MRQLGYELDERHYLVAGPPEPPRTPLVMVTQDEVNDRIERYGKEHPLCVIHTYIGTLYGPALQVIDDAEDGFTGVYGEWSLPIDCAHIGVPHEPTSILHGPDCTCGIPTCTAVQR